MEDKLLSNEIPPFTFDDYMETTEPYEFAYQYRNDAFLLERVVTILSERAKQVKVRNFRKLFSEYLKKKQKLSSMLCLNAVTQFEGQELELSCGNWRADEFGIAIDTPMGEKIACSHPVLPVMRLVNIDTGMEKLVLAYRKGKQWRHVAAEKKTLASNTGILDLANVGIAVNSENSKFLVQYLHDIENLNYESIPEKNSVSRLGWIEEKGFSPYVADLVFDGDLNFKNFFESVKEHGNYEKWLAAAKSARTQSVYAQILLAASFASVLVKPMGGLPFFVHAWGGTEMGKTVGLMLAASVWANPEIGRYIHTFNSTSVGREKSAAFVNSLPLILDELQIVRDKKDFDQAIYMLCEGAGRTRGNKHGGVQKTPTWSNCIITSGEMPITAVNSGGGAMNRILEMECEERLFQNPREMVSVLKSNYGYAGKKFVAILQEEDHLEAAKLEYEILYNELKTEHTTEKQASAAALIVLADHLIARWIFQDSHVLCVKEIAKFLKSKESVSANQRAYEYLCEFVIQNKNKFCGKSEFSDVWGQIDGGQAYIVRNVFNRICEEAGFNNRAFLSWLKQNALIECAGKGFTKTKRINGEPCNCVIIKLPEDEEEAIEMFEG